MNLSKIKTGVYICHCGTNIAATVDVAAVADFARTLEGVVLAIIHICVLIPVRT
jgi:heterodisulfide reductase subunit A-like polyferredoxin